MTSRIFILTASLFIILALVWPFAIEAQQPNVSGAWSLIAEEMRGLDADGNGWVRPAIRGQLDLDEHADTISGTWTGPSKKPWALSGRRDDTSFELRTTVQDLTITTESGQSKEPVRWIVRGDLDAGTMKGTIALHRENSNREFPQPFTAERVKQ
jgi:hypothetical protein